MSPQFRDNLIKFIESHGNVVSVDGDGVVIHTECRTRSGAVYIERERVMDYAGARRVLGY